MDSIDIVRQQAKVGFVWAFSKLTLLLSHINTFTDRLVDSFAQHGVEWNRDVVFMTVLGLALLLFFALLASWLPGDSAAAVPLTAAQQSPTNATKPVVPSAPKSDPNGKIFCCVACYVDVREQSKAAIDVHCGGKRHAKMVAQRKKEGKSYDKDALLKWVPAAEFNARRDALFREAAAQNEDAEENEQPHYDSAERRLNQVINALGKNVTVVHEQTMVTPSHSNEKWQSVGTAPPGQKRALQVSKGFFCHDAGRNIMEGFMLWSKFITKNQEANLMKATDDALHAAHSHRGRAGTFIPARDREFASLCFGCRYDARKGDVDASKAVEMMPAAYQEVARKITSGVGEAGLEHVRVDAAFTAVLEEGMYFPPHRFRSGDVLQPTFVVICGGDATAVFGDRVATTSRQGDFAGATSMQLHSKAMIIMSDRFGTDTEMAINAVEKRVCVTFFFALRDEMRASMQSLGNLVLPR